jgi:hypothetical protein
MKNFLFFWGTLLGAGFLTAQNIQVIPVQNTKKISISSNLPVKIYKSNTLEVKVNTGKQGMHGITISPGSDGLVIDAGAVDFEDENGEYGIAIYTNEIENLQVMGMSDVSIIDTFQVGFMKMNISGNSTLDGNIQAEKIEVTASGASDVELRGGAGMMNATASGASDVRLLDFPSAKIKVSASGASDVYIDATGELDVSASGASSVKYKNEPAHLNVTSTGASEVEKYNPDQDENHIEYNYEYKYEFDYDLYDSLAPKEKKRFAARPRDMFSTGRMRQDLVWMGIDLGVDGLIDLSNGFDFQPQGDYNFMEMNYWRNTHVRLNFFEWRFNLVKNVFNIITGMGFDFQHFAFSQKIRLDEADDYPGQTFTTPVVGITDSIHSINRSRLAVQYFNIPLFLNLRTKKTAKHRQQFNFTFGVVGGIKTGSSSRIIYTENGTDVEEEKKDDFNLETFTATAMVRIKYSFFSIYASYQFTPMFRGQNPNLYPFSLGVTLLSW